MTEYIRSEQNEPKLCNNLQLRYCNIFHKHVTAVFLDF